MTRLADLVTADSSFSVAGAAAWNAARSKLLDAPSVKDYGATGAGTGDDAPLIQNAFDAAPSNSELTIPPGIYLIGASGLSLVGKTNLVIRAAGAKFKISAVSDLILQSFGPCTFYFENCANVNLLGLEIDGNVIESIALGMYGCTDCGIISCYLHDAASNGGHITSRSGTRNRYENNRITGGTNSVRGMWLGNTNSDAETDAIVTGNKCLSLPATGLGGVFNGGLIGTNLIAGNGGSGIALSGAGSDRSRRIQVIGNICRANAFHGIQSDTPSAGDYVEHINIIGNTCEENDGAGIYAIRVRDSVINSNICRDNNNDASGNADGIQLDTVKRVVVTGNNCGDTRAGASRTQQYGISVVAQVGANDIEDLAIRDNSCVNNLTGGFIAQNSGAGTMAGLSFTGNYAVDNGSYGLVIAEASAGDITEVTVDGNHCRGNGSVDLRVDPLDAVIGVNRYGTQQALEATFTDGDTTPSVKSRRHFIASNSGATAITAFDDGVIYQQITVRATNGNTTINNTANIIMNSGANVTLTDNSAMTFENIGSDVWIEVSRSIK